MHRTLEAYENEKKIEEAGIKKSRVIDDAAANFQKVKEYLGLDAKSRSKNKLQFIADYFKDNQFLQEQAKKLDDEAMQHLYQNVKLQ